MQTKIFKSSLFFILLTSIYFVSNAQQMTYTADWPSLRQYSAPEWFRDAKFGIFMHWGVQSVPENQNGWYARHMYMQDSVEFNEHSYEYHIKHYGHPSVFGYKDLIPLWKAEHWDPYALVKFYKEIGAKYIVPVAVHHDNFDNYDSSFQPWNSVNMGPKKDIVGMWAAATRKYGLRFGVSSHSDRSWSWFITSHGSDSHGPKAGVSYDGNLTKADGKGKWWEGYDPADLYSRNHDINEGPDSAYCTKWYNRTKELIDKYRPDLLYFDGPMPIMCESCNKNRSVYEKYGLRIAAYFYNSNMKWHDGKMEAVLNIKSYGPQSIPYKNAVVVDIEKGQTSDILPYPWQTDTTLPAGWFYDHRPSELTDTVVVQNLCDIVSKNGNLLLNVALKPDGTLPADQAQKLKNIGKWLHLNGEAIYGTRPWKVYGEGPTKVQNSHFKQNTKPFTANDVRFTTKGNMLYAIVLGWPESKSITIKSLNKINLGNSKIQTINMLGSAKRILWSENLNGINIIFPDRKPCDFAYVFKLQLSNE